MTRRALCVALCGLDGVGKTTVMKSLQRQQSLSRVGFAPERPALAERMVERRFPRRHKTHRDWIEGEFAEAIAIACAVDYCIYYDQEVRPLLFDTRYDVVVTDRHAICFLALARNCASVPRFANELLQTIQPPDKIIYLHAEERTVERRKLDRGLPPDPFEHPECQRVQAKSYELVLEAYGASVIRMSNNGALEDTCVEIRALIEKWAVESADRWDRAQ